jgi:uncharacterized OB-fold protein
MSNLVSFSCVVSQLKEEMTLNWSGVGETIETYVVGGQSPSNVSPTGTLDEEREILSLAALENIRGVLLNLTNGDDVSDGINVVVTPEAVYASKGALFKENGVEECHVSL